MSCQPELVTGHVDGALDAEENARVSAHLEGCAQCRAQAEAERELRARLRKLPALEPRAGFEAELRAKLRGRGVLRARVLLPFAAAMAIGVLWLRGSPTLMARALVVDHRHCFRYEPLPAQIFSGDPTAVAAWFAGQGTAVPTLPARVAGLTLQGARYCPLLDRTRVAHIYYRDGRRHASIFVVPRELRMDAPRDALALGRHARLLKHTGQTVGLVAENESDVDALAGALQLRAASLTER